MSDFRQGNIIIRRKDIENKLKLVEEEKSRLTVELDRLKKTCEHPSLIVYGIKELIVPLSFCPDCGFHS